MRSLIIILFCVCCCTACGQAKKPIGYGEQTTSVKGKGKDISDNDLISTGMTAGLKKTYCIETLADIKEKSKALEPYLKGKTKAKAKHQAVSKRLDELR